MNKAILFLAVPLVASSCSLLGSCDEFGEYRGFHELKEHSRTIYPQHYQSINALRFQNASGEVLSYEIANNEVIMQTPFEEVGVCDVEPYDRIYSYYDTELVSTLLSLSERDFLTVSLGTQVLQGQLVDVLSVHFVEDYTVISDIALADPFDDNSTGPFSNNKFDTLYQELTIRGRVFNNVYESSLTGNGNIRFYYTIQHGFVAIIEDDELWLVEE